MQNERSSFNNKTRIINHKLNHAKKKSKDDRIFAKKKIAPVFPLLFTLLKRKGEKIFSSVRKTLVIFPQFIFIVLIKPLKEKVMSLIPIRTFHGHV